MNNPEEKLKLKRKVCLLKGKNTNSMLEVGREVRYLLLRKLICHKFNYNLHKQASCCCLIDLCHLVVLSHKTNWAKEEVDFEDIEVVSSI